MQSDTRQTLTGIVAVNVATLAWATNITIGRYLRGEIGPLTLTAARHVVAAIVFTLLLRHVSPEERRSGRNLLPLLGMAAAGIVFFAPLLYFGLRYTTAVNGTLINGMGPFGSGPIPASGRSRRVHFCYQFSQSRSHVGVLPPRLKSFEHGCSKRQRRGGMAPGSLLW